MSPERLKKLSLKKLVDWILATVRPRRTRKRKRITVRYLV